MTAATEPVRRDFLRTVGATGLAVPYLVSSSALAQPGKPGANDRLSIALIGCGGMGRGKLERLREPAGRRRDGCMRRLAAAPRERCRSVQDSQAVRRLPRTIGPQRPRRRDHRHSATLALPDGLSMPAGRARISTCRSP